MTAKCRLKNLLKKLQSKGIDGMLVTDHDTYNGYLPLEEYDQREKIQRFCLY